MAVLREVGGVICGAGDGTGSGGQEALRAARRHRDRRVHPADREQHHEQEDRRGGRRTGARRQDRLGRLHAPTCPGAGLAETMVRLGNEAGVTTRALITAMDVPLGLAVGNALEVTESVEVLAGGGPADVVEITVALRARDARPRRTSPASTRPRRCGTARPWMCGSAWCVRRAAIRMRRFRRRARTRSSAPRPTGSLRWMHGHWRGRPGGWGQGGPGKQDPVSAGAGIMLHAKPGDAVAAGTR